MLRATLPRNTLLRATRRLLRAAAPFRDPNPHAARAEQLLKRHITASLDAATLADAVPLARQAAAAGSPRGQTVLASLHLAGLGVPADPTEARRLFESAASAGDPVAMCSLGAMLLDDSAPGATSGHTPDAAAALVSDASTHSLQVDPAVAVDPESGDRRGVIAIRDADGAEIDTADAATPAQLVRRVRKARRRAGYSDTQALSFEQAKRDDADRAREAARATAVDWLDRSAATGNDTAMVLLGNALLASGDAAAALQQYERAIAATRNTDAYFNAARLRMMNDVPGIERDEKAALKALAMAAQLGDPDAQAELADLYLAGSESVKADPATARQFLELAVEQRHAGATYQLALMHRDGVAGLEASNGAFLRRLREAADGGYGSALALWADMYYKGADGVEVDYEKAVETFTAAGRAGVSDALCSAAAMTFRGLGTKVDHVKALQLYQDAAVMGNITAHRNIATMYYNGQGVPTNKKMAEHFFRTADELEHQEREEVESGMDPTIRTTEAPRHPMDGVPQPKKGEEGWEEEEEWNEEEEVTRKGK